MQVLPGWYDTAWLHRCAGRGPLRPGGIWQAAHFPSAALMMPGAPVGEQRPHPGLPRNCGRLWGGGFTGREDLNTCPPRFVDSLWAQGPAWPFLSLLQQLGHPHPFCWGHFKVVQTGLFLIFRCLGQGKMSGLAFGQSLRHGHLNPFPLQAKPCPG